MILVTPSFCRLAARVHLRGSAGFRCVIALLLVRVPRHLPQNDRLVIRGGGEGLVIVREGNRINNARVPRHGALRIELVHTTSGRELDRACRCTQGCHVCAPSGCPSPQACFPTRPTAAQLDCPVSRGGGEDLVVVREGHRCHLLLVPRQGGLKLGRVPRHLPQLDRLVRRGGGEGLFVVRKGHT